MTDAGEWARICRTEAALTTHLPTKEFLLELAREYEALACVAPMNVDPDDHALQNAVGDRLSALAARIKLGLEP